jgi:DNA (cytosine-5)-methyltransferase 1
MQLERLHVDGDSWSAETNLRLGGAMHWNEKGRFSLPEFRRFGSFPDEFIFAGRFEEGIKQIGNCVPPLFMKAIAECIHCSVLKFLA